MITLPLALAACTAGLIGGVHCVGMCGGISTLLSNVVRPDNYGAGKVIPIIAQLGDAPARVVTLADGHLRHQVLLQSGRLTTYMLIGAFFGAVGIAGLQFKPFLPIQQILYVLGNLCLVLLGLRLLGLKPAAWIFRRALAAIESFAHALMPAIRQGSRYPFLIGMSWGCLPCGLLYGMAPFALLAGDPLSGALLMLLFGLTALPHLLFTQGLAGRTGPRTQTSKFAASLRIGAACTLVLIGLFGLWYFDMKGMPDFLCVTPAK
jgi:sulfite exporter TauE/SafE